MPTSDAADPADAPASAAVTTALAAMTAGRGVATASGLTVRPPTMDDLDAVVGLFAAAAAARPGSSPPLRREDLRVRWLMLDHLDDAVLVLRDGPPAGPDIGDAGSSLLAYASAPVDIEVEPDTGRREAVVHLEGEVHPEHRGRGLGTFLLDRAVATGRAALHEPGQVRVRTALVDPTPDERTWFRTRGFAPVRHLLELRLDLHAPPPAPRWPAGVTVRTFRPGADEDVLWRTHQAAFEDVPTHLPIGRGDFLADRDPGSDPGLVLLAEHGHPEPEVVAVAVCRAGTGFAAEEGLVRDLGVLPHWRRRGVAMALLRTAFATFRARGLTGVALEVDDVTLDGAVALYRRAGMRVTRRTDILERSAPAAAVSEPG